MGRGVRRPILWGTMAVGGGKRRSYVFRVDPAGLLAVRIGTPLSWSAFFVIVLGTYVVLGPTALGLGSLLAGAAMGMAVLGVLDRAIARAAAAQPRDQVLRSAMNVFVSKEDWSSARFEEGRGHTYVEVTSQGRPIRVAIGRPRPPAAREALRSLLPG
ncbi:MAG: hypothetical protein ACT4OI_05555 [Methanobacteriota archaeon]